MKKVFENANTSLVRVGGGRGFVMANLYHEESPPFVITAAHCIPEMPAANLARHMEEETFLLLGPLFGKPSILATVCFYDPMADIAVLGEPDSQTFYEEAKAYEKLLAQHVRHVIATPSQAGKGFVYDLKGKLQPITYRSLRNNLLVEDYYFKSGMSGSPILDTRGRVLALVSTSGVSSPWLCTAIPGRIKISIRQESKTNKGTSLVPIKRGKRRS